MMPLYYNPIHVIDSKLLYPAKHHYNCSIMNHGKNWRLVYRCQNEYRSPSWLAWSDLDHKTFQPLNNKKLEIPFRCLEDPRWITPQATTMCFFNSGGTGTLDQSYPDDYTIYCAELSGNMEFQKMSPLTYAKRGFCEKNWMPFIDVNDGCWKAVYSINPWRVIEFDRQWKGRLIEECDYNIPWQWGQMRGGSLPYELNGQYWMFFHSAYSHPLAHLNIPRTYVGGLICFEGKAPFKPCGISLFPIMHPDWKDPHEVSPSVVFPSGAIYDRGRWIVSAGYNDDTSRIYEFDHLEITSELFYRKF